MARITIDPVTRIEGHLRIDAEVDGGVVRKAWSSGQMFRGIERILLGRDPRDAWLFTQRFCGVCTTVHAITSVRAVENALKADVPKTAALAASLSDWPGNSAKQLQAVKDRLAGFVAKGQLGIFTNG